MDKISATPRLEAQILAAHVLKKERSWLISHDDTNLTDAQTETLNQFLNRLINEEPLPYIIEKQEFFGLSFRVTPQVLIPRPETEQLVEITLNWLKKNPSKRQGLEIGTGSGCIAISLCKHIPDLHITATDISRDALQISKQNADLHQVSDQIDFQQTDLLPAKIINIDFLCANLPYIPSNQLHHLKVARYEPQNALDGGKDGFSLIARLLSNIQPQSIKFMIFELDSSHSLIASEYGNKLFPQSSVKIVQDLAGHDRFLVIET